MSPCASVNQLSTTSKTQLGQRIHAAVDVLEVGKVFKELTNYVGNDLKKYVLSGQKRKAIEAINLVSKVSRISHERLRTDVIHGSIVAATSLEYAKGRIEADSNRRASLDCPTRDQNSDSRLSLQKFVSRMPSLMPRNQPLRKSSKKSGTDCRDDMACTPYHSPENGRVYKPGEVVKILEDMTPRRGARVKRDMIQRQLVPVKHVRSINRLLKGAKDGSHIPNYWNSKGRPAFLTLEEMQEVGEKLKDGITTCMSMHALAKEVEDAVEKRCAERGQSVVGMSTRPCRRTLKNMMTMMVVSNHANPTKTVLNKTDTRYTAERSIRCALSLACMIGATEFIAGTPSAGNEIPINISQGAREFVDMVKKAYGHDSVYLVEQLCAYSALAYSCAYDHPGRNLLTETDKEGGTLFCWSTETIFRVHKLSFRNSSQKMKQLHMVSYLFELCYDLALSRHFNVSENPGFEVPLGLGGSKNTTAL